MNRCFCERDVLKVVAVIFGYQAIGLALNLKFWTRHRAFIFPRKRGKVRNNPIFERSKIRGLVTQREGIRTLNVYSIP